VLGRGQRRQVGRVAARCQHEMPVLVRVAVQHHEAVRGGAEQQALARLTRPRGTEDALPLLPGGADVGHPPGRPQDVHALLPCRSGYHEERLVPALALAAGAGDRAYGSSASAAVHGLPSTRRRSSFPTLKNGTRLACTATSTPVLGFRPSRACRCFTTKLPKPRISMRSPRVSAWAMLSKTAFTITSASRREKRGKRFST